MKLWGGRFENQIEKAAFDFQWSIHGYRQFYRATYWEVLNEVKNYKIKRGEM